MAAGSSGISRTAGWLFVLTLALAPLLFGGHVPLAWAFNALLTSSVLLFYQISSIQAGNTRPLQRAAAFPFWALVIVCAWIVLQGASWTPGFLHHPLWTEAANALGEPVTGGISVNPSETDLALLRLSTAGACAWLGLQIGADPRWARRITGGIAVSGALYATYGLSLRASGSETVLWIDKSYLDFPGSVTGPFINPNSFAAYAGISLACAFALFLRTVRIGFADNGLHGFRRWLASGLDLVSALAVYALLFVPLFTALVLSRSRAGFVLAILAAAMLLAIETIRGRTQGEGWGWRSTFAVVLAAVGGSTAILVDNGDFLLEKIAGSSTAADFGSRFAVAKVAVRAIADRPVTGFGYGTFADVFPLYRDATLPMYERYFEAHNAYLEAMLGLGLPAAAIFFAGLGYMAVRCFRGAIGRRRDHLAPAAAAAATLIVGLHALVDFSIQLEGIAMTYAGLLGAGFAQSWSSRTPIHR